MIRKKRIVIGIHGVGNKPPQPLLQKWWRRAICEGFDQIGASSERWTFDLVYWAQFLYSDAQDVGITDSENPLFVEFPYEPEVKKRSSSGKRKWRKRMLNVAEVVMDWVFLTENQFFNFDRVSDYVVRKKFADLAMYYHPENVEIDKVGIKVRKLIRNELARVLRKHRRKEILLLSHSMGTIVAYDVLTHLVPKIKIHTLITLGSPLGLPNIMKKIYTEMNKNFKAEKTLPTPENIEQAWYNFSDLKDPVAMNHSLADDFRPNAKGVGPNDIEVHNEYEYQGAKSPHKSYGYLRTEEVAQVINDFLTKRPPCRLNLIKRLLRGLSKRQQKTEPAPE